MKFSKKLLSLLLCAIMVLGSVAIGGEGFSAALGDMLNALSVKASAATNGIFTYSVSNDKATITDCSPTASNSITIPSTIDGYPVTAIGSYVFCNCPSLTSVTIPNSVTSIGSDAFYNCTSLTSVTIPNSVTSIGSDAFGHCTSLTSLTIPNSVTSIGKLAFRDCTGLTSITIPDSVTYIDRNAFRDCTRLTSITMGNSVTSIGEYAFYGCTGLTSIIIPDSVTSIGSCAFEHCTSLTSITIPNSVKSIGSEAFKDCTSLTSVTIPDSVTSIGSYAFGHCTSLTSLTIPDSVTSIGIYAFCDCTRLTSITMGNSVTSIDRSAFESCTGLTSITVDPNNKNYSSDAFGVLFNKDKTKLIQYPIGNTRTSYTIPDSVTSIGSNAFYNCTSLTSVTIPDSVTIIGSSAFEDCTSLASVTIPDSVTSIGSNAFGLCTSLTSITIPDSVTIIGSSAFYYCTSLTSITVDPNNKNYSNDSFGVLFNKDKTKLFIYPAGNTRSSYSIPDSVTSISNYAFEDCTSLTSVTIPDSVTGIGSNAFVLCTSLTSVTIPDSVTSIGGRAFGLCTSLTSVTIPDSVTSIGGRAFDGCTGLKDIYYSGSESQWNSISKYSSSIPNGVTIHFNNSLLGNTAYSNVHVIDAYKTKNAGCKSEYLNGKGIPLDGSSGSPDYCIPGQAENMVPQGLAYWAKKDWILISSYSKTDNIPSSVFALDRKTGTFAAEFDIYYSGGTPCRQHVGGVAVSDNNLYITKDSGVAYIPLSELDVNPGTVKKVSIAGELKLSQLGGTNAAYIDISDGILWAGNFYCSASAAAKSLSSQLQSHGISIASGIDSVLRAMGVPDSWSTPASSDYGSVIAGYKLKGTSSQAEWDTLCASASNADHMIMLPAGIDCVQGATFKHYKDDAYTMFLSCTTNASFGAKLYRCEVDLRTKNIYPTTKEFSGVNNLPGAENIAIIDNDIYTVYESGALNACGETMWSDAVGKDYTDVLWKISINSLINASSPNDSWFNTDGYGGYNHELARYCAEMVDFGYCYNKTTMNNHLYQAGFTVAESEMHINRDAVNNFIASKPITVNGKSKTLVMVGCIGSDGKQWLSNFDPLGTDRLNSYAGNAEKNITHLGFADARDYVLNNLQEYFSCYNINPSETLLVITGHSRGAATANLLAAKLDDNTALLGVPASSIYAYTFATPNVSKNASNNGVHDKYRNIFNIVNPEDPVTKVIPSDWGYGKYGKTLVLPSKSNDNNYSSYKKEMQKKYEAINPGETYTNFLGGEAETYYLISAFSKLFGDVSGLYKNVLGKSAYSIIKSFIGESKPESNIDFSAIVKELISKSDNVPLKLSSSIVESTFEVISDRISDSHEMKTYLAYMLSLSQKDITTYRSGYKNTVNCPVDIEIYEKEHGEIVGRITNNVVDEEIAAKGNSVAMFVDGDSKIFWLPSNGDYEVKLIGNDEGTMDYTVAEMDSDLGETERINFFDVEITDGKVMEGTFESVDFEVPDYTLTTTEEKEIESDEFFENKEVTFNVSVNVEGKGTVTPSLTAVSGDYITLSSRADAYSTFNGWYENNELISDSTEFSFVVKENREITAVFDDVDYSVSWKTDENENKVFYHFGDHIIKPDEPIKEGYDFKEWSPGVPETMPAENLEFYAVFEPKTFTVDILADSKKIGETSYTYGDTELDLSSFSVPEKEGCTGAWDYTLTANGATVNAVYTPNSYTIKWVVEGTETTTSCIFGEAITTPQTPTKEGYTFTDWNPGVPKTMPSENLTFTALFEVDRNLINAAISELETVKRNSSSDEAKDKIDSAIKALEEAASVDEVNSIVSEARSDATSADKALADAKTAAKADLATAKNNVQSDEAKAAIDAAITNVDKATNLNDTADAKAAGLTNAENAEKSYAEKTKFDKVSIKTAGAKTIDYRNIVTIKATAENVPEGYQLALYVNGTKVAEGDNKSVTYEYGELKSDINYTVKVIDANGKVQKDSNGNELSKDGGKITCNAGFFKKLIAFFKGLFKSLPKVEVKP